VSIAAVHPDHGRHGGVSTGSQAIQRQ
jgi:hypothetical protein